MTDLRRPRFYQVRADGTFEPVPSQLLMQNEDLPTGHFQAPAAPEAWKVGLTAVLGIAGLAFALGFAVAVCVL